MYVWILTIPQNRYSWLSTVRCIHECLFICTKKDDGVHLVRLYIHIPKLIRAMVHTHTHSNRVPIISSKSTSYSTKRYAVSFGGTKAVSPAALCTYSETSNSASLYRSSWFVSTVRFSSKHSISGSLRMYLLFFSNLTVLITVPTTARERCAMRVLKMWSEFAPSTNTRNITLSFAVQSYRISPVNCSEKGVLVRFGRFVTRQSAWIVTVRGYWGSRDRQCKATLTTVVGL